MGSNSGAVHLSSFNAKAAREHTAEQKFLNIPLATMHQHSGKTVQLKKPLLALTQSQADMYAASFENDVIFGVGSAGTGKTYLMVGRGVVGLLSGEFEKLIFTRPAVEAGERLGFLPGDMKEKVDPYLRPIYDALYDFLPAETVEKKILTGEIEIAPLAFMRGRTLANAFVLLDEAQNTTSGQMKMFLTRLGAGSTMAVCGDEQQCDLPLKPGEMNGLREAVLRNEGSVGIAVHRFDASCVVRHPTVATILGNYEKDISGLTRQPPVSPAGPSAP